LSETDHSYLKGIEFYPWDNRFEYGRMSLVRTDENGFFSFPVTKEGFYSLSLEYPQKNGDYWYAAEDIENIRAGENLTIVMQSYTGVFVRFNDRKLEGIKYEGRLESDKGKLIQTSKTIKRGSYYIIFIGVPNGTMRAVIETEKEKRYQTSLFELKDGKSVDITMKIYD